ncbi:Agamous-like MADS-box protein AGL62 [Linum grandiflorum]
MSISDETKMTKTSKGRQKVEMVKMVKDSNRQVTFSKRRSGLFKKASELCTLCGVDIAIIVFSPGQKAFSFGHPSIQDVVDRFLARNPSKTGTSSSSSSSVSTFEQLYEAHRNAQVRELNGQLTQVVQEVERVKKYGEGLNQVRKVRQKQYWWETPIGELELDQLHQLKASLEELSQNMSTQKATLLTMQSSSTPPPPPLQFLGPAATTATSSGRADYRHSNYDDHDVKMNSDNLVMMSQGLDSHSNHNYHLGLYGSGF